MGSTPEIRLPLLHRFHDLLELMAAQVRGRVASPGEELLGGQVAVGALDSLVRDEKRAHVVVRPVLEVLQLDPQRILDDLLEKGRDEVGVESQASAHSDAIGEELLLAGAIPEPVRLDFLGSRRLDALLPTLAEKPQDLPVDRVDVSTNVLYRLRALLLLLRLAHGPNLESKEKKGIGLGRM